MSAVAVFVAGALFTGFPLVVRGVMRASVAAQRRRLLRALSAGEDLAHREAELRKSAATLKRPDPRLPTSRPARPQPPWLASVRSELELLHAVALMEMAQLDEAQQLVGATPAEGAWTLASTRLLLLRNERATMPPPSASATELLGKLLVSDTRAQIALADGHPDLALQNGILPTTRARALAALRRDGEALVCLNALAPSRVDAMLRSMPDDPASRLWMSRGAAPYR